MRKFVEESDCQASIGHEDLSNCDDINFPEECTQMCLDRVSIDLCNKFNTQVDKCNEVKKKEISLLYDKCFDKKKQEFIMAICEKIKTEYVPLRLVWFPIKIDK